MKDMLNPFEKFDIEWGLVTSGDKDNFNSMTISWGSMGTIWHKDVITIYIRPERYTHSFLEDNDYFTVSFFSEEYRNALNIMGSKSGRDVNKAQLANLTAIEIEPGIMTYKEAKETYVCKKIYTQKMNKEAFGEDVLRFYGPNGQPHTMFIGEIIKKL